MNTIICDASFWLSLYARVNMKYYEFHEDAVKLEKLFDVASAVYFPWPSLYLLINTKFLKNQFDPYLQDLKKRIADGRLIKFDDSLYREVAYEKAQKYAKPIEDCIVEEIFCDQNNNIEYFLSFKNKRLSNYLTLL